MSRLSPGRLTDASSARRRGGFSLIELLTVIAIIAVLVAIIFPVLGRAKESANVIACASNLRQVAGAMGFSAEGGYHLWGNDLDHPTGPARAGEFPGLRIALKNFDVRVCQCPSDRETRAGVATAVLNAEASVRASYDVLTAWTVPLDDPAWTQIRDVSQLPIAWDINGGLSRERARALPDSERQQAIRAANHYPRGGNVVYGDGHVKWLNANDWKGINDPGIPDELKAP